MGKILLGLALVLFTQNTHAQVVIGGGGTPSPSKNGVANAAALPVSGNKDGDTRVTLDNQNIYVWKAATSSWIQSASPAATAAITALNTDVSATGPGAVNATIQPNVVTNAKMAPMPAHTFKANNTAALANGSDISTANAKIELAIDQVDNTSDASKPISTATQTALNAKEPTVTGTTSADYYRGDKTFQNFNSAVSTAIGFTPENVANKDTDGTLAANSDTKYASQKATKTYADTKEPAITVLPIAKGGTNSNSFTSGTVPYFDGTSIKDANMNFTPTNNVLKVGTINNDIELGSVDAFSRSQIWNKKTNATLRLGALGQDGDFGDVNSEGIVAYGPNSQGTAINSGTGDFGYARVKADRFGLYTSIANTAFYYFRVDPTEFYLKSDANAKTFSVTRATGVIKTTLGTGVVQSDASGILSSSATLANGTLAATQAANDNSTKIATTAYADAAAVLPSVGTPGTYTKVTTDVKGRVTSGTTLSNTDMPSNIDAAKISSGIVSNTEFDYIDGATSNIQAQLDAAASSPSGKKLYVSKDTGNDANTCTFKKPCLTIQRAINVAEAIPSTFNTPVAIFVAPAKYTEDLTFSQQGVNLSCDSVLYHTDQCQLYGGITVNLSGTAGGGNFAASNNAISIGGMEVYASGAKHAINFTGTTFQRLFISQSFINQTSGNFSAVNLDNSGVSGGGTKSTITSRDTDWSNSSVSAATVHLTNGRLFVHGASVDVSNGSSSDPSILMDGSASAAYMITNNTSISGPVTITDNTATLQSSFTNYSSNTSPCITLPSSPNTGAFIGGDNLFTTSNTNVFAGSGIAALSGNNFCGSSGCAIAGTVIQSLFSRLQEGGGKFTGMNITGLTASLPIKTGASKNLISGAINLASGTEVTGTLPISKGGTGNTSGTSTINANLTGPITSVGNATSVASQTGTGTKFVMDTSPTLTGSPLAPTQSANDNSTKIATTAYADNSSSAAANAATSAITSISGVTTGSGASKTYFGDTSGGAFTFTLPAAASFSGVKFTVKNVTFGGSNNITVARTGADTVEGATSDTLTPGDVRTYQSNGTNWFALN